MSVVFHRKPCTLHTAMLHCKKACEAWMVRRTYPWIVNRPDVARAVLQIPALLTDFLSHTFLPNFQNIITPKLWELDSWIFERMFTPHHMSHFRSHVSNVMCQVSEVEFFRGGQSGGKSVNNGANLVLFLVHEKGDTIETTCSLEQPHGG